MKSRERSRFALSACVAVAMLAMSNRRICGLALIAALLCCAGCSARPAYAPAPLAPYGIQLKAAPAASGGPFLYVAGGRLSEYALGSSTPLHSVSTDASQAALALDLHGNLCESNGQPSYSQIYTFNAQTLRLEHTLNGQGWFPALVADHLGYIYASTSGPRVLVYAPGCTQMVHVISTCAPSHAFASGPLVFDGAGHLFVGNGGGITVCVYAPTQKPEHMRLLRAIQEGINGPYAFAIGPSGELFVANLGQSSSAVTFVSVFPPGSSTPTRKITKGIHTPIALAVDSKGWLYVANAPSQPSSPPGWVSVYAPGGTRPIRKLTDGKSLPTALALDPSGNVYVAGFSADVYVYSPGGVKLMLKIAKGILHPEAMLIGSP